MIAILRVRFTSNTSGTTFFTDTLVDHWMQPLRPDSLANYWWWCSHGLVDLDYTLLPEITVVGAVNTNPLARPALVSGLVAAADSQIAPDWDDVDILLVLGEQAIDAFGGGGTTVTRKDGTQKTVAVTVVDCRTPFDVVCQELGHSLGFQHETRRDRRADIEPGSRDDYASPYSCMSARYGSTGFDPEYRRPFDPDLPDGDLMDDRIAPALRTCGPRLPGAQLLGNPAFADSASVLRLRSLPASVRLYAPNHRVRADPAPMVAVVPQRLSPRVFALELRRGGFDYDRALGTPGAPPEGVTVHSVNDDASIRYDGVAALGDSRIGWASRRGGFHLRFDHVDPDHEFVDLQVLPGGWTSFLIRGVLLVGGFRTQRELIGMPLEDMRNTLIVELSGRTRDADYQRYDDEALAGRGALLVFFRHTGLRDDATLRTMSADDLRNTLIVELDAQTHQGRALQAFTDVELVHVALGSDLAVRGQVPGRTSDWIRGVLLLGRFRTQHELNAMSADDMRNTLIVELTGRTADRDYQVYDDLRLAGTGAVLVAMRALRIRDDATLRTMTADGMRNTFIVEMDGQTHLGAALQSLSDLELALIPLGVQHAVD